MNLIVETLSFGANDNASGLVALLQLAAIFNRLYSQKSTHGSYNIVFLVTGGGRFNFQGTRTWLENADATTCNRSKRRVVQFLVYYQKRWKLCFGHIL